MSGGLCHTVLAVTPDYYQFNTEMLVIPDQRTLCCGDKDRCRGIMIKL